MENLTHLKRGLKLCAYIGIIIGIFMLVLIFSWHLGAKPLTLAALRMLAPDLTPDTW